MQRKLALLLSILFILILAACGNNTTNKEASGSNSGITDTGVAPQEELVIKATNYSFDSKEYHLKKGVPVKIVFENESGNHGILIPEFNLTLNRENSSQVIVPEEAGTFEMSCSIMCGSGHSNMIAKIIVD
ncbi:cupredoxin domain-containing protein [Paenibacillus wynnii]|uniref:cupredoxin domain-containing protein n=1 Tax=Paenibacillus wynnii TaxID=268407 RepID=UPI0027941E81|nr:cupredoxin domain-containing protein [Paenibacillus wynnii]MDQ0191946.1 cytochrome c oxidase subunit 2 [Paenibacillus wynnii]